MVLAGMKFVLCVVVAFESIVHCDAQFTAPKYREMLSPLPFPICRADNIDCLRRGLRTFFFIMDSGYFGMRPVDPLVINSLALALPEQQMSFLLRRVNVTGARWTKLAERRFNSDTAKNGAIFNSDLHVTAQLSMENTATGEPRNTFLTMDIQSAESNITYPWRIQRGIDKEDYMVIGPERVAVRNSRTPSYFLQPRSEDSFVIDEILQYRPSILDHFANEITTVLIRAIVDNFRLFATSVPIRHYYQYYTQDQQ